MAYATLNRRLRRIEGQIKANERRYTNGELRTSVAMDAYVLTGIGLMQKLLYAEKRQQTRFDDFESSMLQERMERAEVEAGWDPNP